MKFTESLKKPYQFRYIYKKGRSIANRQLVMYVYNNGKQENRLGISVSKKIGKSVVRSRTTRLIRESYRLSEEQIKKGYDIILVARASARGISYHEMYDSLHHLLKKHGLLVKKNSAGNAESREETETV